MAVWQFFLERGGVCEVLETGGWIGSRFLLCFRDLFIVGMGHAILTRSWAFEMQNWDCGVVSNSCGFDDWIEKGIFEMVGWIGFVLFSGA